MNAPSPPFAVDTVNQAKDLESRLSVIVRIRSMVLIIGAIALRYTTEVEGAERQSAWDEFEDIRDKLTAATRDNVSDLALDGLEEHKATLSKFVTRLAELTPKSTRDQAIAVEQMGQKQALASLYGIIAAIDQHRDDAQKEMIEKAEARAKALQDSFNEMERIGQFIRLISLNASVEAARTGGDAGRAFMVIADEVRNLATRSAKLLASTRTVLDDMDGNMH